MRQSPTVAALLAVAGLNACSPSAPSAPKPPSPEAARLLAELPPRFAHADPQNGRLHFNACRSCHTITAGGPNLVGPNLYGVVGRKVASHAGYSYSDALKAKDLTWDADRLDAWLKSPQVFAPGTKMSYVGIKDDADRRDVIAYLKVAGSGVEP